MTSGEAKRTSWTILTLTVAVALAGTGAATLAPAGALDGILVDGVPLAPDALRDGLVTGRVVHVPAGVTVHVPRDLRIVAEDALLVDGALVADDAPAGTPAGNALTLASGGRIVIAGSVVTAAAPPGRGDAGPHRADGANGGDAPSLVLDAGASGTVRLLPGSLVRTGNGGAGGAATVVTDHASPLRVSAEGGDGGGGGDVAVIAGSVQTLGRVHLGSGGAGGAAVVRVADATPPTLRGEAVAVGGDGGEAGALTGVGPDVLHEAWAAGRLTGGAGGRGGDASAHGSDSPLDASEECGRDGSWDGARDIFDGRGMMGCRGTVAQVRGGNGGCATGPDASCLVGGDGGSAEAHGGKGGRGGQGADGLIGSRHGYIEWIYGADGGLGGWGGPAQAWGGHGGFGIYMGGRGGDILTRNGDGGDGGDAGAGGAFTRAAGDTWIPNECQDYAPRCWIGSGNDVCGHSGPNAGPGIRGENFRYRSYPGSAGGSFTTLTKGPGMDLGHTGGARGTDGSSDRYPVPTCVHAVSHGHV